MHPATKHHRRTYSTAPGAHDLQALRKKNLAAIIEEWHGPTALAAKLDLAGPSYLSQLAGPHKPITEKTARHFEELLGLPPGWMDHEHQPNSHRFERMTTAVLAAASEAGLVLSPRRTSRLLAFVYEAVTGGGKIDDDYIRRLVELLKEDS